MLDTTTPYVTLSVCRSRGDAKIKKLIPKKTVSSFHVVKLLKAATAAARAEVFDKMAVGDVVTGKVARITSLGAHRHLGGVDGLIPPAELSRTNVAVSTQMSVGDCW